MDAEEMREYIQANSTQQEQLIDIMMVLLAHFSSADAAFLDWVHNTKGRFLSNATQAELAQLKREFDENN